MRWYFIRRYFRFRDVVIYYHITGFANSVSHVPCNSGFDVNVPIVCESSDKNNS